MKIQITSEGVVIATATLDEHASARDFAALLLHAVHRRLELLLALGATWRSHKDFSPSTGLVRLGRLDSGVDSISRPDAIQVRIERLLR
ncbi:hypothetical protein [Variovorax paradoxus]|uniref:hypothetical protein n=1 Tax=Variovorax paradoxus TaxID=34073 RepID=UPI003ECFD638